MQSFEGSELCEAVKLSLKKNSPRFQLEISWESLNFKISRRI